MTRPTAARRLALWKVALGSVAVAAALLAFAAAANAAVIQVAPGFGANGKDNLTNAIATANTNGAASNTIVLARTNGPPATPYKPQGNTAAACPAGTTVFPCQLSGFPAITSALTITGDHSLQAPAGVASTTIDGSGSSANLFTVASNGNLTLEAIEIESGGGPGNAQISDSGTLTTWGVTMSGAANSSLILTGNPTPGTATLNETTLASNNGGAGSAQINVNAAANLTLNNSTIGAGTGVGIANSSGTFRLNNSLLAFQAGFECTGVPLNQPTGPGSVDDDGTCVVQYPNQTSVDTGFPQLSANGGPTLTYLLPAGSFVEGKGTACPTTDQRFFVHGASCDSGAVTRSAARNTTPPSCTVTGSNPGGTPPTQTVTLSDAGSGMGPESGTPYDPNSQTSPQPQNARVSTPVPSDAISGLGITNGTVAISALPTAPTRSSITLTASKTTTGTLTHWWFTATDWAGNVKFCQ